MLVPLPAPSLAALAPVELALGALMAVLLAPVCVVDVRRRRIPNALTVPAAVAAVLLGTALDPAGQLVRTLAALAAALFLLLPALARPDGMGMGDVKLAGVLGLCLGPPVAIALAAALGAATAFGCLLAARLGVTRARAATLPFGPFLAAGGLVALAVAAAPWHVGPGAGA